MNANLFDILARGITDPDKVAIETAPASAISYADLRRRTGPRGQRPGGPRA